MKINIYSLQLYSASLRHKTIHVIIISNLLLLLLLRGNFILQLRLFVKFYPPLLTTFRRFDSFEIPLTPETENKKEKKSVDASGKLVILVTVPSFPLLPPSLHSGSVLPCAF